jgi:transcriptional regulator with XRE-family HTH domain
MGTPFGDFVRDRRDATPPESVGVRAGPRRRVPGLRRSELAALAGISTEYLVRLEQGSDRHPSIAVVGALADALRLDAGESDQLRQLAKRATGTCIGSMLEPQQEVRPTVQAVLDQLEPGIAYVTTRHGELLAVTAGFDVLARPCGILDSATPNLTRFVFTNPRARAVFPDWERVADERAFELGFGPRTGRSAELITELTAHAGADLTSRIDRHHAHSGPTAWRHPDAGDLWFEREVLELPAVDGQQLVVLIPASEPTADALAHLRRSTGSLRAVN